MTGPRGRRGGSARSRPSSFPADPCVPPPCASSRGHAYPHRPTPRRRPRRDLRPSPLHRHDEARRRAAVVRCLRGPRAWDGGGGEDGKASRRRVQPTGAQARQQRQLDAGRAAGRDHHVEDHADAVRGRHRVGVSGVWAGDGRRHLSHRREAGRGEGQPGGLRRLRHQRAREGVERLCRCRRARQDGRDPRQRPRLRDGGDQGHLQRPRDDVLRALDV